MGEIDRTPAGTYLLFISVPFPECSIHMEGGSMKREHFSKSFVPSITLILAVGLAAVLLGCAGMPPSGTSGGDRSDVLYSCNCGPQCKCNSVSVDPGNCKCGVPLKWGHILKVEGDETLLCQCKEGCQCKSLRGKGFSGHPG